ncbi:uncharacterized protein KY384_007622 [Bacidia gigantensis]|uniref:uncharacterized protein n=1 Tax=Bacidia gigantensis TaxID=2732470 RepID=UPI001D049A5E|nr:uncharacterized protein KY384_007622 [Bacidia gigantensis]KAG8527470.1 hypothetical protein KY384_007622 [Bacidia gigantensis]
MVFNKFSHLARPSLSKTFAHGYAQSFVAGAQTSAPFPLSKHQTAKAGRPKTAQQHTAFSTAQTGSSSSTRAAQHAFETAPPHDGGLKAYYDAWQNLHQHGGEWRQFQFPKLIEPRAYPKVRESKEAEGIIEATGEDASADRATLDRSYSTSAVDDIRKAQTGAEEIAVAQVDEAIATVIKQINESTTEQDHVLKLSDSSAPGLSKRLNGRLSDVSTSPPIETEQETSLSTSPVSTHTAATSVQSDPESQAYLQRIYDLSTTKAYRDVPRAFETLLSHGIQPTVEAYNALLASAINIPMGKHQLVPKALGIYSDMLRRKVAPDVAFYSTIIEVLSRRALYVAQMKRGFEEQLQRYGAMNRDDKFLFASHTAEYNLLVEDDALSNALRLFANAISKQSDANFSTETYQLLIHACARQQNVSGMVQVYQHLEHCNVEPAASIFPEMIAAFGRVGDIDSALECYNEYRTLAIADDGGKFSIVGRNDATVYASLIRAYRANGKDELGQRFLGRITESFATDTQERHDQLLGIRESVDLDAKIRQHLDDGDFETALAMVENCSMSRQTSQQALKEISIAASDSSNTNVAIQAHQQLSTGSTARLEASVALLALHVRNQDLMTATSQWIELRSIKNPTSLLLEPTVHYIRALMSNRYVEQASNEMRAMFSQIRATATGASAQNDISDQIDEAISVIALSLPNDSQAVSAVASSNILWAMVENGGIIPHIAEQVMAELGPEQVTSLGWQDLALALQVQAGLLNNVSSDLGLAHISRMDHLINLITSSGVALEQPTMDMVEKAVRKSSSSQIDIFGRWNGYKQSLLDHAQTQTKPSATRLLHAAAPTAESYDPHAATTDYRGSTIIVEELENHRNSNGLKEALNRFRNIRRAGMHPRYIVYAKLITAAAKEGRTNLIHDILGMARHDVPFKLDYPVVRHGWSSILDAMVGACLTAGKRVLAEQFHQEMLDMGSAPSANTYGLYITTLKESTKTFDEATEAVKIFHRAASEGVIPSSFLYNALIGKLGKARRIDDCLRYFQEMRAAGIRPTSVTYGTVVNALCRVSDERFAEELFDEMESMPNYKPRPAPYNSLMQYFLTTKRDSEKVLAYYLRMQSMNIQPTMHTYKLLIDTYATLEPINLEAAEGVLDTIRAQGFEPEAVHYASLIHAKGCVLHDMEGAREVFDKALASHGVQPHACLYQALFESMVANHCVAGTEEVLDSMSASGVEMTPYIANTLIHGWAMENRIAKSKAIYDSVGKDKREPSTYESMTRAFLTAEDRQGALNTVHEMLSRGYPSAVSSKILELVGHGTARVSNAIWPNLIA